MSYIQGVHALHYMCVHTYVHMYVYVHKQTLFLFIYMVMHLFVHCIVKCSCHERIQKNSINYICVGPSIPVCSCIEKNCQVDCIDV